MEIRKTLPSPLATGGRERLGQNALHLFGEFVSKARGG
jgi:hypothetical protein